MVLESLTTPIKAENHPARMFLYGFAYMSVALFLAQWIFSSQASIVMVFLATMACIPLIYNTIIREENKDLEGYDEKWLLKEHSKALSYFMYLFIGVTLATALWYVVLPADTVSQLFITQSNTINAINAKASEDLAVQANHFSKIFFNNVKVLIFCVLFSFIYGSGAIFILNWNATVVGTAIGNFIRGGLTDFAQLAGLEKITQYLEITLLGLVRYAIHGIPEILSYFTAGLAGGIISVAVIQHDFETRKFEHVLLDSADLLLISIALVFVGAVLEVFVTPVVFG